VGGVPLVRPAVVSPADRPAPHEHHLRVERTARYYTLGGGDSPADVWFVLHGYGQLAREFIRYFSDLADEQSLIIAPEALNRYYTVSGTSAPARDRPVGATWMTREDRDAEIEDYVDYLDALHAEVAAPHVARGARVHVLGFSQGAATASRWMQFGRAHADRLILWGGILPPDADLSRGPQSLRGVSLTYVVGSNDEYVTPAVLDAERARLSSSGVPYELIEFSGGHVITRSVFPGLRP
jgi:predicted esterase